MSCAEVFSYALLLKGAERAVRILELLEEGKREEVKTTLDALKGISPEAIRQLWRKGRIAEDLPTATGG